MSNEMQKLLNAISMCRRAGKLAVGYDAVIKLLDANSAQLVLFASDFSATTREKIISRTKQKKAKLRILPLTMDDIWFGMGKRSGILATGDINFAAMIAKAADNASEGGEIEYGDSI